PSVVAPPPSLPAPPRFPYTTLFRSRLAPRRAGRPKGSQSVFEQGQGDHRGVGPGLDVGLGLEHQVGARRPAAAGGLGIPGVQGDRKSTRLNSSHVSSSYAVFCLKKKNAWERAGADASSAGMVDAGFENQK